MLQDSSHTLNTHLWLHSTPTSGYRHSTPTSGYRHSTPTSGYRHSTPTSGYRHSTPTSPTKSMDCPASFSTAAVKLTPDVQKYSLTAEMLNGEKSGRLTTSARRAGWQRVSAISSTLLFRKLDCTRRYFLFVSVFEEVLKEHNYKIK